MKPTIIIALEGVILDFFGSFINFVNKIAGKHYIVSDIQHYSLTNLIGGESLMSVYLDAFIADNGVAKLPLRDEGIRIINDMEDYFKIVGITSFNTRYKTDLIVSLMNNNIIVDEIIHSIHRNYILLQYKKALYIDDCPAFIERVSETTGGENVISVIEDYNWKMMNDIYFRYVIYYI
jgi:hypothetical protein